MSDAGNGPRPGPASNVEDETQIPHAPALCESCALATSRRAFLHDALCLALAAAAAASMPAVVEAAPVLGPAEPERRYPIPATDGATIDRSEGTIIVRWQGSAYAMSLACPHQNAPLTWEDADTRFECPKHHSRFQPDGTRIEGRATRGMDRFPLRVDGADLVVDLGQVYQQDTDGAAWMAAVVHFT